jgi:hypothetical protein
MDARSRRKLGMAANPAAFSRGHPDESPGYQAVLSSVDEKLARAKVALAEQRSGLLGVHANSVRKLELRRTMREAHLGPYRSGGESSARRGAGGPAEVCVPAGHQHACRPSRPRRARS